MGDQSVKKTSLGWSVAFVINNLRQFITNDVNIPTLYLHILQEVIYT